MAMTVVCKDCRAYGILTSRPAPHPGPRCVTHHRAWRKRTKANAHGRMVEVQYGITAEQYWRLYAAQGGVCAICRKANGKTKRLAVEHEHGLCDDHPPDRGCPRCIRCLSCGRCNRLIAFLGPDALRRAIGVLEDPPARKVLANA
jgi:hypothetical protein